MDADQARAFLREHHRGVLATVRSDGRPQMSAVLVGVDEDGYAALSTREAAYKVRNMRRDPRVSVFAVSDDFSKWIQIDWHRHRRLSPGRHGAPRLLLPLGDRRAPRLGGLPPVHAGAATRHRAHRHRTGRTRPPSLTVVSSPTGCVDPGPRTIDPDAFRSALTFVTTRKAAKGSGTRSIADLTVEATDIDLRLGRVVRLCRVPGGRSEARSDHSWPDRGHSCRPPFVSADAGRS